MLKLLRLSSSHWLRECRRGQWTILLLSLVLAVTAISSVQFITERIQSGLSDQSAKLLGGNLAIISSQAIPAAWVQKSHEFNLKSASIVDLQTMVTREGKLTLINLQAVSEDYPLTGTRLSLHAKQGLVDQRLLTTLETSLPVKFKIGSAYFQAISLLPDDIEISYSGWLIAPRVIIRLNDLAATQTLLPGSRASYRLLLAGSNTDITAFRTYLAPLLTVHQRMMDTDSQRFSLLNNFTQIEQYIQLIVLFCLFMCGVAIFLSIRQYVKKHHQDIALWRCLGASSTQIRNMYLSQLIFAATISGFIGISLGYLIHSMMMNFISSYFPFTIPPPSWEPYAQGFLTSIMMLFCFAYPLIQYLPHVKPLALWRDEVSSDHGNNYNSLIAFSTFILFTCWLLHFTLYSLFVIACFLVLIAVGIMITDGLFKLLRRITSHTTGAIRRGLSQIIQFPLTSGIQIGSFTIVITLMIVLQFMKMHILDKWQDAISSQAPNYFAFNLAPEDLPTLSRIFAANQLHATTFFPMIKGRLISVNQQPVLSSSRPGNNHNALHRDLNISSSLTYPTDNQLQAGSAWTNDDIGKPLVSVESSLATALQLKVGDKVGFMINGKEINTTVSNIRTVNWASFNPNFYIIFPPKSLAGAPATYIVSFYLPAGQSTVLTDMIDKIPSMTIVDMADTLDKIQGWIKQATTAIQGLFIFSLLASIIIFIASLITTLDERRHTYRLIHVLGGSRPYIIKSIVVELAGIFAVTLIFSYSAAFVIYYTLIHTAL